jgi:hypothetical protein
MFSGKVEIPGEVVGETSVSVGLEDREWLRMEYQEICDNYMALRDFRAKLLGFLPLVTSGIFLLLAQSDNKVDSRAYIFIGVYGFFVTVGLAIYEFSVRRQFRILITRGDELERRAKVGAGQFTVRQSINRITRRYTRAASTLIYGATMAAWVVLVVWGFVVK